MKLNVANVQAKKRLALMAKSLPVVARQLQGVKLLGKPVGDRIIALVDKRCEQTLKQ